MKPAGLLLLTAALSVGFPLSGSAANLAPYGSPAATSSAAAPPKVPETANKDGIKTYLLTMLKQINTAAADLKQSAAAYDALLAAHGSSPEAAAKAKPQETADLIKKMRDAYARIDSYGYEYIEGIVAGAPDLMKYDVELDSGIPAKGATKEQESQIAQLTIKAGSLTVDEEGSLNNYLIEATVFGTNPRFTSGTATLPGFDKPVNLPNPKLCIALADYAIDAYARLTKEANAWKPTDHDCFHILASMTPTLADYFDEWKETKLGHTSGRFVAVTRLSDMRGIMSGTRLTWLAMAGNVKTKDAALAQKITDGYDQILHFIDTIEERDKKAPLSIEAIDALGSKAREVADRVTVQDNQAAALMGIDVNPK